MTEEKFKELKGKLEKIKVNKVKAEAAIETIEAQWKKDYGINNHEEAEEKLEELRKERENVKKRLESLEEKIEVAADWDNI